MAILNVKQMVPASAGVIADARCSLYNINGENHTPGTVCYFQLFNKVTAPVNGDVPVFSWRVPADGGFNANMPGPTGDESPGEAFLTGCSVGWSTTQDEFTDDALGTWYATAEDIT